MYELHFVALCMLMFLSFFLLWISEPPARRRSWQQRPRAGGGETRRGFQPPKPRWVRDDVIRLKALMPDHGCRAIAAVFNHLHSRRRMTVGKSFVADVVRRHRLDVVRRRREMKHRKPRQLPKNLIWATDLTFVADELADKPRPVLGLIDHGTRACLRLQQMRTKASIALIREIFDAIERFGKPKILRTDNEAVFTSVVFRGALFLLGIKHQLTLPGAPWQNGRIERFFGTLKERLRTRGPLSDGAGLQSDLAAFRFWYNHARTHQHLDGRTPAMAWDRCDKPRKKARYFSAWEGVLTGFYFPT